MILILGGRYEEKFIFFKKKLYTLVTYFLSNVQSEQKTKKRGRPQKYNDRLIMALWLYQTLMGRPSQRNSCIGFSTKLSYLSLHDCHYRVKNLNEKLLKVLIKESSKIFFSRRSSSKALYC
jgi:hypothetical protein